MIVRRRSQSDYLTHLASVPLFSQCHRAELKSLAQRTADINAGPGQVLVQEGHGAYDFFVKEVTQPAPFVRPEHFADAAAILGEKNDKIKTVDLSRVVDASFVQSAVDRGLPSSQ